MTPDDLLERCNETLISLTRPRLWALSLVEREDIPVGVTGKVLKAELRRRYPDLDALRERFGAQVALVERVNQVEHVEAGQE